MENTKREYLEDVEGLAQEVLRRFFEDGDELSDAIHETVNGSQWVTARASKTLEYSYSRDAVFYEDGLGNTRSMGEFIRLAAFFAMRSDVMAKVEEIRTKQRRRSPSGTRPWWAKGPRP
jgi:hypothetical protein